MFIKMLSQMTVFLARGARDLNTAEAHVANGLPSSMRKYAKGIAFDLRNGF